ncbi:hypothetical protein [Blastochloris sulfoviridis]|uniref:Uncharacterized protein n=1 Tax=Blastochloris sulfoviridis TaxID=50712 RepID=A0A5M6I4F5_9HYPH|nr:hypothetical protein [Blastochloris sulfoviridis]KAA5602668.1 hypothetical protein F1193_04070 [Blastochloris sulfoviridis]
MRESRGGFAFLQGWNGRLAVLALVLNAAGCVSNADQAASLAAQSGLVPVAFESISGAPQPVFDRLVADIARESEARRVLIVSRNDNADYRVRAYLAAHNEGAESKVAWVFDVFDASRRRTVRLSGEEVAAGSDAWSGSSAAVAKIAAQSVAELSQWLRTAAPAGTAAPRAAEGADVAAGEPATSAVTGYTAD